MSHILTEFKTFLDRSPTAWHAVKEIGNRLALHDFIPLDNEGMWSLEPGKKYFTEQGGALCAFSLPSGKPTRSILLASHTDSPALKVKPNPTFTKENMTLLGVEVYGSPLLSSWLNRDLILAGRVVTAASRGRYEEKLVILDDAPLIIPQLAIHLDREVNEKGVILNKQEHLCPILGLSIEEKNPIEALLKKSLSFTSLLSFELFLVPKEQAEFIGWKNELIASYRIDNLASAHAALTAFAVAKKPTTQTIQMAIFFDHEEVGSRSFSGAASTFLNDTLQRIGSQLKMSAEELILLKNHSLCVSIDMAHALNPNYPQKYDPQHQPLLGKGVVLKHNADQKYASNALSSAVIVHACQSLGLPLQSFVCRSDLPCGSTVGPIIAHNTGINTVDIGCPQLSMHSIREVLSCKDYLDMTQLLTYLLEEG